MKLAHTTRGEGDRPVVFVHGFLGHGRGLAPLASRWLRANPGHRAVLPDLPGHGDSPPVPERADLSAIGAIIRSFVDAHAPLSPVPVVAHSMGGRFMLRAWARDPERFGPLVLLDVPPGPISDAQSPLTPLMRGLERVPAQAPDADAMLSILEAEGVEQTQRRWARSMLAPDGDGGIRWTIDREALLGLRRRTMAEDLWPVLREGPRHAIRVVFGAQSPYLDETTLRRFDALDIEVQVIPGAGHYLHVERTRAVVEAMGDVGSTLRRP